MRANASWLPSRAASSRACSFTTPRPSAARRRSRLPPASTRPFANPPGPRGDRAAPTHRAPELARLPPRFRAPARRAATWLAGFRIPRFRHPSARRARSPCRGHYASVSPRRASRRAAHRCREPRADRRYAARDARSHPSPEAKRSDLVQLAGLGRLGAAIGDILLEGLEGPHCKQRVLAVLGLPCRDVHEAHTVVQLECRVAKSRGRG